VQEDEVEDDVGTENGGEGGSGVEGRDVGVGKIGRSRGEGGEGVGGGRERGVG
jgi:hypothetical protein